MIFALLVSASNYAAEVGEVDCPALNESSVEKGAQEDGVEGNEETATQE